MKFLSPTASNKHSEATFPGEESRLENHLWLRGGLMYLLIIMMIIWAGAYFYLDAKRSNTLDYARQNTETIAQGFAEQIRILSADLDRMLLFFREIQRPSDNRQSLGQITKSAAFREDLVLQIASMDENGILTDSNLGRPNTLINLADRAHFRVHKESNRDSLYISDPVRGRVSGKYSIQFSRKILGPNGEFRGVIVASVSPEKLSSYYNSVKLGDDGAITLFNDRAVVLARSGAEPEQVIGKNIRNSSSILSYFAKGNQCVTNKSILDEREKLICFQAVSGFPLGVAVAIPLTTLTDKLDEEQFVLVMINTGVTLLGILAFLLSVRRERQLQLADISTKQANAEAQRRALELATTLRSIDQGIAMFDVDRNLVFENPRATQFKAAYPDLTREIQLAIENPKNANSQHSSNVSVARHELTNEHGQSIEARYFPAPGDSIVVTLSDVTAARNARMALEHSLETERRSAETVKTFLAVMSHEIRTPLHTILGFSDIIAKTDLSLEQREYLQLIANPAKHIKSLIADILDFTYLESGQIRLHLSPISTPDLLSRLQGMVKAIKGDKPLDVRYYLSPSVPQTFVGDEQRILQLIVNLISNAIKYTNAGSVSLSVTARYVDKDRAELCFEVADTGIGMSETEISGLFQPFVRGEKVMNVQEGTGLGLAICKQIIRLLKGDIRVKSELGRGSTFSVQFFVGLETRREPEASNPLQERLPCLDVLVAEDNTSNRLLITKMLEAMGQRVVAVENGLEAVRQARTGRFDVIILDIQMPILDGISAAREISAILASSIHKPVLAALTAQVLDVDRTRASDAGFTVFLEKPLHDSGLRAFLAGCAEGR